MPLLSIRFARETLFAGAALVGIWFSTTAVADGVDALSHDARLSVAAAGAWVVATMAWLIVRASRRHALRPSALAAALLVLPLGPFVLAFVIAVKTASP